MHAHATFSYLEDNIWFESINQTCGEINDGFFISRDSLSAQSPDSGAHGKNACLYTASVCLLDYSPSFSMSG